MWLVAHLVTPETNIGEKINIKPSYFMFRHKVTSWQLNSAILIPVDQYTKPPGTIFSLLDLRWRFSGSRKSLIIFILSATTLSFSTIPLATEFLRILHNHLVIFFY